MSDPVTDVKQAAAQVAKDTRAGLRGWIAGHPFRALTIAAAVVAALALLIRVL